MILKSIVSCAFWSVAFYRSCFSAEKFLEFNENHLMVSYAYLLLKLVFGNDQRPMLRTYQQ